MYIVMNYVFLIRALVDLLYLSCVVKIVVFIEHLVYLMFCWQLVGHWLISQAPSCFTAFLKSFVHMPQCHTHTHA